MVALSLFRRREVSAPESGRVGIIDIGSNSIRLVVFDGPARVPAILFNEKVMAGLGRGLALNGALDAESMDRTLIALKRFAMLARSMNVIQLRTVATAAVREASNGAQFLRQIAEVGLEPELLSGDDEAMMAGNGVLAGIPGANGIVADLGGGSLELVRVGDGKVQYGASFPFGVLRVAALHAKGRGALERKLGQLLTEAGWNGAGAGLPLYLVGGSWRSLARLDMDLNDYPLPIVHGYEISGEQAQRLVRVLAHIDRKRLRGMAGVSASRLPNLPVAAGILSALVRQLQSETTIISAFGLREGLLYQSLSPATQALDPLIEAAHAEAAVQGRFPEHGDLLNTWIEPLFTPERFEDSRLRHTACLLADIGWRAHPEFRAERGVDVALHGNWVGIDARGRGMLARALYTNFGGTEEVEVIDRLIGPEDKALAQSWGLAMRLGQRLSGGVADALSKCHMRKDAEHVILNVTEDGAALLGEAVERRLKLVASSLGKKPLVKIG